MTQQEFRAIASIYPNRVNIWCGDTGPPYAIYAITIPVINSVGQNALPYLQLAQQLAIPLVNNLKVVLNIVSREYVNNQYYYFSVETAYVQSLSDVIQNLSYIEFLPAIDSAEFYDSPYNVLNGSIEEQRKSSYIMQSDRYKIGTLANPTYTGPLNIAQLLSGSASLANVKDSNYTDTGWTRGRYEGTKTSATDYYTVPAIGGTVFEGSEFPASNTPSQISYLLSSNQIFYKNFFFAGTGDTPGFVSNLTTYLLTGSLVGITAETNPIYIYPQAQDTTGIPVPTTGTIYRLDSELVKVVQAGYLEGTPPRYIMNVIRGYNSVSASHFNLINVYQVEPVQIYNITGNKLSGVPKGQVLVRQTGVVNKLDSLGYIVTSSKIPSW